WEGLMIFCCALRAGSRTALLLGFLAALDAAGADERRMRSEAPSRPVHTYSIVARDPETGQLGVAVQSHWFSVGSVVPWAESGIGAVATQAFGHPSYGFLALQLMPAGRSAPHALTRALAVAAHRDER